VGGRALKFYSMPETTENKKRKSLGFSFPGRGCSGLLEG